MFQLLTQNHKLPASHNYLMRTYRYSKESGFIHSIQKNFAEFVICVVKIFNFLVLFGGIQIIHCPLQRPGNHPYSIIGITMKFAGLPITTFSIVFLFILLWSLQRRKNSVSPQHFTELNPNQHLKLQHPI